ncbi:MAG: hypothetical protein KatS3mg045_1494 [Bellilinea sp.]|nr:MAG: hypothetical protein KatS3mg045_1494 [Bellilinea sp.]
MKERLDSAVRKGGEELFRNIIELQPRKIALVANTDWYLYNFRLSFAEFLRQKGVRGNFDFAGRPVCGCTKEQGFRWLEWNLKRRSMNPLHEMAAFLQLWGLYRRERPHLVHHLTVKPVLYGSLSAALSGVPAVVNAITGLGYLVFE